MSASEGKKHGPEPTPSPRAREHLHSGAFLGELDRRVAYRTESQNPGSGEALRAYLEEDLQPAFAELDFSTRLIESPSGKAPYLFADYRENASRRPF